jgi:hypothetical protein
VIVGETGFPSAGQSRGAAVPSEEAQARFTEDLLKLGAAQGMSVMVFTSFDEAWKGAEGPVGANWGLWRTNRAEKPAVARVRALPSVGLLPGRSRKDRAWRDQALRDAAFPGNGGNIGNGLQALRIDGLGRLHALPASPALPQSDGVGAVPAEPAPPVWTIRAP